MAAGRNIVVVRIHPAIGVARVGNSPTEFFIGPERTGVHARPPGGYKDGAGRVKRQAARFRVFGYDSKGRVVREITASEAAITWTVHVANRKAAWHRFESLDAATPLRNPGVADRQSLVIDPGPRSLTGRNQSVKFDSGTFLGTAVPLGEGRTDARGRLLVLGGFGRSASPTNARLTTYDNNDGWHDDVSDGPVRATLTLRQGGESFEAVPAWVIVGPPKFTPSFESVITLYDVLRQAAVDRLGLVPPARPSFTADIYPLLRRAARLKWVSAMFAPPESHDDKPAHASLSAVIPPPGTAAARRAIFGMLRDPDLPLDQDAGESNMPMIWSDLYLGGGNQPLTRLQYANMKQWRDGKFINDWSRRKRRGDPLTPEGLDRAALQACVGAALCPGIEAGWLLRDKYRFMEPFRLDPADLEPGDVTKQMAVPWQADFFDCKQEGKLAWWPAQRPDDVFRSPGAAQLEWTRDLVRTPSEMIERWHRLGFIVRKGGHYLETERKA